MKQCERCGVEFPNRVVIDSKIRNLKGRKYCLTCSPFGLHNTRTLHNLGITGKLCKCGETSPDQFRIRDKAKGQLSSVCKSCHKKHTMVRQQNTKRRAREYLGDKCQKCGFSEFKSALCFHHLDPTKKHPKFEQMRSWKWEKVVEEIKKCILLCSNCHLAHHNNELVL